VIVEMDVVKAIDFYQLKMGILPAKKTIGIK
jgi:hypothetical protein